MTNPSPLETQVIELVEKLAEIEHERWADWQAWCHKILRENCPSPELEAVLERWDKQISTPYSDLTEAEKQSDRDQVDRYLPLIQSLISDITTEAVIKELESLIAEKGRFSTSGYGLYVDRTIHDRILELKAQPLSKRSDV
jgi:hypothetical protein